MFSGQVLITGGSFTHTVREEESWKVLREQFDGRIAPNATHDTSDLHKMPECHPNTRVEILDRLEHLVICPISDNKQSSLIWLYGAAGAGKSAIGRSLAKRLLENTYIPVASFFMFSTDPGRNTTKFLFPTLASQIAFAIPTARSQIIQAIKDDPLIFHRSIGTQFQKLIMNPLLQLSPDSQPTPCLAFILIDGLDECKNREERCCILEVIFAALPRLNGRAKFMFTSRPEHDICSLFEHPGAIKYTHHLDLSKDLNAYDDIRRFLQDAFVRLKQRHPLKSSIDVNWPSVSAIECLVSKSSGNFIYPSIVMKYIEVPYDRPSKRLDIILHLVPTSHKPFAELDALYHRVLSDVRTDRDLFFRVLKVVAPLCTQLHFNRSVSFVESLMENGDVYLALLDMRSLVLVNEDGNIEFLHKSFEDYLFDPSRSMEFHINIQEAIIYVAHRCLDVLKATDRTSKDTIPRCLEGLVACANHGHAIDNVELRQAIEAFDLNRPLFRETTGTTTTFYKLRWFLISLHCEPRMHIDDCIRAELDRCVGHSSAWAYIITVISLLPGFQSLTYVGSNRVWAKMYSMADHFAHGRVHLLSWLGDLRWGGTTVRMHAENISFVQELLCSRERAGKHYIDEVRVTQATIYFLEMLQNNRTNDSDQILSIVNLLLFKQLFPGDQIQTEYPTVRRFFLPKRPARTVIDYLNSRHLLFYPPAGNTRLLVSKECGDDYTFFVELSNVCLLVANLEDPLWINSKAPFCDSSWTWDSSSGSLKTDHIYYFRELPGEAQRHLIENRDTPMVYGDMNLFIRHNWRIVSKDERGREWIMV